MSKKKLPNQNFIDDDDSSNSEEEIIVSKKRIRQKKIFDSDSESDKDEKKRDSRYLEQSDEENYVHHEDRVFSARTRKSMGLEALKNSGDETDDDSSQGVITDMSDEDELVNDSDIPEKDNLSVSNVDINETRDEEQSDDEIDLPKKEISVNNETWDEEQSDNSNEIESHIDQVSSFANINNLSSANEKEISFKKSIRNNSSNVSSKDKSLSVTESNSKGKELSMKSYRKSTAALIEDTSDEDQSDNESEQHKSSELSAMDTSETNDNKENSTTSIGFNEHNKLSSTMSEESSKTKTSSNQSRLSLSVLSPIKSRHSSVLSENTFETKSKEKSITSIDLTDDEPDANNISDVKKVSVSRSFYETKMSEINSKVSLLESCKKLFLIKTELPDGGLKLKAGIVKMEAEIALRRNEINNLEIDEEKSIKSQIVKSFRSETDPSIQEISWEELQKVEDVQPKFTGKIGMAKFNTQKVLTVEKLATIQESLASRPAEDFLASPPKYMKTELMAHQLHALAFMTWREKQRPRGKIKMVIEVKFI